jgi:hypothetical protein
MPDQSGITLNPLDCQSEIQIHNNFSVFSKTFSQVPKHLIVTGIANFAISLHLCLSIKNVPIV